MNLLPEIIYEDDDVVVINKPAGLLVHPTTSSKDLTLADWVVGRWPRMIEVGESSFDKEGEEIARPGVVHRLDRDTSGVMILAKNQKAFLFLKEQFKNREVKKTYRALVSGKFKETEGKKIIDLPIGRSKSDPRIRVANKKASSKLREALTEYEILETFDEFSYVEAKPKTGRTHQLRAHFKAIQHPIACDFLYTKNKDCPLGLKRQALHAYLLEIKLPNGKKEEFKASMPEDMLSALDSLRKS